MNAQESNAHLLREIRSIREQTFTAADMIRSCLHNHQLQLEKVLGRLEKLELELGQTE